MDDKLIKVLIIEDNPEDFRLIEEMLKEVNSAVFELHHSKRLSDGLRCLVRNDFDILLLDLSLPDSVGLDTFFSVYEQAPEIPIVILSGFNDEETAIKAVSEGAQDYLVKGQVNSPLLSRSISYAIERKLIEDELIRHRYYLNELVEKRTEELERANKYLQEEIKEKETLIDEIYRRIQFTLELISIIITIDASVIKEEDSADFYIKSQTRINAIMMLNEILDQSEDFAMVNFNTYTALLINYLLDVYAVDKDLVKLNLDMGGVLIDINTAIILGLILNELISDELKYEFIEGNYFESDQDKCELNISLKSYDGTVKLVMNYDGIGEDINGSRKSKSMLKFIMTILEHFNGSIEFIEDKKKINLILSEIKV
ncbi:MULTISPECIES: response regulator [Methanobacterium]|uniref:Response regulator n=1 Tax=Methanobacterium veterum TaxID=408577 RepID=A0A9E4ZR97_9EURY|nr:MULTISPECIES: response regulator [Methanobacterium]MCZ3364297.1 response regulator [Methanobacterium veterum]MCZ3372045.1 response regulator [Methanobacterium veterum]